MPKKSKSSGKHTKEPCETESEKQIPSKKNDKKKKNVTQSDILEKTSELHLSTPVESAPSTQPQQSQSYASSMQPQHQRQPASSMQPQQQRQPASSMQPQQQRQPSSSMQPHQQGPSYASSMQPQHQRQPASSMQPQQQRQPASSMQPHQQGPSYASSMQPQHQRQPASSMQPHQQGPSYASSMQPQQQRQPASSMQPQQQRQPASSMQPHQQGPSYASSMQPQQQRQPSSSMQPHQQGPSYASSMQPHQQGPSYASSMQPQQQRQPSSSMQPHQQGPSYASSMQPQHQRQPASSMQPYQQGPSYASSMQPQQQRQPASSMQPQQQRQPSSSMQPHQQGPSYASSMQPQQRQPSSSMQPHQQGPSYASSMQPQQRQPSSSMQSQQRPSQIKPGPDRRYDDVRNSKTTIRTSEKSYVSEGFREKINVATNFYALNINPKTVVYHYHVTISPDKPVRLLRNVWKEFCSKHFQNRLICFDGKTIALSKGPLDKQSFSAKVTIINPENNREMEFDVAIKEVGTANYSNMQNYRTMSKEISFIEIILKNYSVEKYLHCKKSFFPPDSIIQNLSEMTHLRMGYFQSVFLGRRLYLNFDISYMPFYNDCNVREVYDKMNRYDQSMINVFFNTVAIEYGFPNDPASLRIFRVNKLVGNAFDETLEKDGVVTSIFDYFKNQKNYNLLFPQYPLLWVGPKNKSIYLPMELCRILPNQFFRGSLSPYETGQMVRNCTTGALERMKKIKDTFEKVYRQSNPFMQEFGLTISQQMLNVEGKILKSPYLKANTNIQVKNGEWNIHKFLNPVTVKKWCVLILDKNVRDENIWNLEKVIKQKGQELGIQIDNSITRFKKCSSKIHDLNKVFQELEDMDIVFVIISEKDKGAYSRVKKLCEIQKCILTQCIKSETLNNMGAGDRKMSGLIGNILLKVNAKLGGGNHSLSLSNVPPCLQGFVMIVGADVTHPSPGSALPSVAAVAVSYDQDAFKYSVTLKLQKEEIIKDLKNIMKTHLSEFLKQRGRYPEKILFFRDGVSEGEMKKVSEEEVQAVKQACSCLCNPEITFVIVSKRHHTRFFPLSKNDEDGTKNCNVPIGTCVETEIVHSDNTEFYLLSHKAVRGTARPTRYLALYDDNNITKSELEEVVYFLCHMFARCNKSVSYPSPTYYAHLGAFRARSYLEEFKNAKVPFNDLNKVQDMMKLSISQKFPMFFV